MMTMPVPNTSTELAIDIHSLGRLRQMANNNAPEAIKEAAQKFESLFINMMLQSMRQATSKSTLFDSHEQGIYTSMLDQQLSQSMSERGIGLADMMLNQIKLSEVAISPAK